MSRTSRIVVIILTAALVALSLFAVSAATAQSSSSSKALLFTVVKRTQHYEFVRGHGQLLAVKRGAKKVILHGVERYRVVKRTRQYVFLRAVSPMPTIVSPNGGTLVFGVSTSIAWRVSAAVSTGYFRVYLQNVVNGASTSLTASEILARKGATSYSVPWKVSQLVGTCKLRVYCYSSSRKVIGSDVSDDNLTVVPDPTPTPTPTPDEGGPIKTRTIEEEGLRVETSGRPPWGHSIGH